jgi:heat shock protein HtpX
MGSKFINNFKTVLLLGGLSGFILAAGALIGGSTGITIALFIAIATNFVTYFYGAKLALMSMQAQEVGPDHYLYRMTEDLSRRAGLPMPKVYISPQMAPNAFAAGRGHNSSVVCATEGLLQLLDRDELAGVMAHELAHIKHRDVLISTIAATLATVISYLGYIFMFSGSSQSQDGEEQSPLAPIGAILMIVLAPIAAMIIQMAISRQREYAADTEGAAICGNPMYLARALDKVHNYANRIPMQSPQSLNALMIAEPMNLSGKSMANWFSTHPPLEKRLFNLIGRESLGVASRW